MNQSNELNRIDDEIRRGEANEWTNAKKAKGKDRIEGKSSLVEVVLTIDIATFQFFLLD